MLSARYVVPAVTPLRADGSVDAASMVRLVGFLADGGAEGVLLLGSTGEAGSLGPADRAAALAAAAPVALHRGLELYVGLPSLGTRDAVERVAELACVDGVSAVLAPPPFFFQLSQSELATHYRTLAAATELPVVAYDVPIRVQVALDPATVATLAAEKVVAGLKDSTLDLQKAARIAHLTRDMPGFRLWTGAEESALGYLAHGYDGIMPGICNIEPAAGRALIDGFDRGDLGAARAAQGRIIELTALFGQSLAGASGSPRALAGLKVTLAALGVIDDARTAEPFTQPDDAFVAAVRETALMLGVLTT